MDKEEKKKFYKKFKEIERLRLKNKRRNKKIRTQNSINLHELTFYETTERPPKDTPLGLDIEFVRDLKTNKLLAGWVAICQYKNFGQKLKQNCEDNCVYQSKIYHNLGDIDLMTKYSGLTRQMINNGREFDLVRAEVQYYLENYLIIGANIKQDLSSLLFSNYKYRTIDIQYDNYFHGIRGVNDAIKLRTLAYSALNKRIQEYDEREHMQKSHSPIIDARITVELYIKRQRGMIVSKPVDGNNCFEWCRLKELENVEIKDINDEEKLAKQQIKLRKKRSTFQRNN